MENFLSDMLELSFLPMTLWCDNCAAEASTMIDRSLKFRHMTDVKYHYVRECVARHLVKVRWITSKEHLADIFTKPLSLELHNKLASLILNLDLSSMK